MDEVDTRAWSAHLDSLRAEGRIRVAQGGGEAELPGVALMASGLPFPQWNSGQVTDPARLDLAAVRAWYASRGDGTGVPWALHVPAGMAFGHGRCLFRKRCMALPAAHWRPAAEVAGLQVRLGAPAEIDAIAQLDAEAFGDPAEQVRDWIGPRLAAEGFELAVAELDGVPVGVATAIRTRGQAGPCVGIYGVGVREAARRRGIGAAVTSWLLARAFAGGADFAHLNPTSDEAASVYRRLGFRETAGLDIHIDL